MQWAFCKDMAGARHRQCNLFDDCRIFQVNDKGSVPVLKDLKTGKWLASSDDIVDILEDQYPEPALGKADSVPEA
jgi:glutathione S-transferase